MTHGFAVLYENVHDLAFLLTTHYIVAIMFSPRKGTWGMDLIIGHKMSKASILCYNTVFFILSIDSYRVME